MFRIVLASFLLVVVWCEKGIAQTARQKLSYDIEIRDDLSLSYIKRIETTPLNDAAVQSFSQHQVLVKGTDLFELAEAYTRKADGRVLPVNQAEIATQDGAVGPLISLLDVKVKQVPFRDLSVGDTWVLVYKITEKDHYVPDHVSWSQYAPPSPVDLELAYSLRAPAHLELTHSENDLTYEESRSGETITRRWSGKFTRPVPTEKEIANFTAYMPSIHFSTLGTYESLGKAFYSVAAPKAAVTPAIEKLANDITAGREDVKAQAQAIFDWVSKNVSYVAVFFGSGRFVPNEAGVVLDRHFGDCKDHATLMMALLSAKKIQAEYVLIGANLSHELTKTPVVEAFNHVILYIPALNLYADPTSPTSTFGHLPNGLMDRPVLRISPNETKLDRTPSGDAEENTAAVEINITLDRTGKPKAEALIEATGNEAQNLRAYVQRAELNGQQNQMQMALKALGLSGDLVMSAPPSHDHAEPYRVKLTWVGDKPLKFSDPHWNGAWGLNLAPADPVRLFGPLESATRIYPSECRPARIVNKITMEFPKGVFIQPVPEPYSEKTPVYLLKKEWSFSGNTLRMKTELTSSVRSRACSPELIKAITTAREKGKTARNGSFRIMKLVHSPASAQMEGLLGRRPASGGSYFGR
jgi:Transglutaminase-like superfamily/Domain of Unknown Function with PDB structure (DUF3857)